MNWVRFRMYSLPDWSLKELAAVVLTQRLGTVTAAARALGMSQSATSRLIAGLEGKLGHALFERVGRGVVPSPGGQAFFDRAAAILDAAGPDHGAGAQASHHLLRLVAPPSFCTGFLQEVIAAFLAENPQCEVRLDVHNTPALMDMIAEARFDLGLTSGLRMEHPVRPVPLKTAGIACMMRRDHPLGACRVVTPEMIAGATLIQLSQRHASRAYVDGILAQRGIVTERRVETSTGVSALLLARYTDALALMSPFPLAAYLPDDMVSVPFDVEYRYDYSVVLPLDAGTPPHVRRFLRLLRQHADAI